jgi:hypothetical protein
MKRREFLKTSALVVAGTAVAASGLINVAGAGEWTGRLTTLQPHEATTLLAMAKRIFPHRGIDDSCYVKVVEVLDANSKSDPYVAKILTEGIVTLDGSGGTKFADRNENDQVAALEAVQTTPFFVKVRGTELESLYSNPAMWKAFGYQGPAYAAGGYIHRGFNDLNWLPDPPESASPKPV